jgi:sodium/bile acid cotransporter 7
MRPSSNVVMTGQAGGDQSAATIEVMIGNLFGAFLTPALIQLYTSSSKWSFGALRPSEGSSVSDIYVRVIEQLGFSVFIPLAVGEVIQWMWPVAIAKWTVKLRLSKVGQVCLLLIIW